MIGLIHGTVDTIRPTYVIIDTGGVGYKVIIPQSLISKAQVGLPLKVYTYTHVREDVLDLFGFASVEDLSLFELFLTVPGIGPKTAVGIFAAGPTSQIRNAVVTADISFFSQVPRLGRKNAQKIIIELKSKLGDSDFTLDLSDQDEEKEIAIALKDLGFKSDEVSAVLKKVRGQGTTLEQKMKLALKQLGK